MENNIDVKIIDNSKLFKQAKDEAVERALEAIGLQATNHAKDKIRENGSIDTSLLRNSIAYAVSGKVPSLGAYGGTAKQAQTYKADKPDKNGEIQKGTYTKQVPKDSESKKAVYIGTAVEYAPYVEYGHIDARTGKHIPAKPFLEPAATQHTDEYKTIAKYYLTH